MRYILAFFVSLVVITAPAFAFELYETNVDVPYTIVNLESDIKSAQTHLGELKEFPIMYGFRIDDQTELSLNLAQRYTKAGEEIPFALILVKEEVNGRGVKEILRFNPKADDWRTSRDKTIGLTFWESQQVNKLLEPGTYRLEVSTSENLGKYLLNIALDEENNLGYFENLSRVRSVQAFYDFSIFKMLVSSLVYYPLGIILLLLLMHKTWKYRKSLSLNA